MGGFMQRDWRELCAAVANETDSDKLNALIPELIRALDEGERRWREPLCWINPIAVNQKGAKEVFYC